MKTEELLNLGLTKEQVDAVFALAGKDITKHQKTIETLTAERDDLKTRLETAENTVSAFEGMTPEDVKAEIEKYKNKSEEAGKRYEAQITARDQRDWLNAQYEKFGVTSPYARTALTAEVQAENSGVTWKDGGYMGFEDFMKKAKEKDGSIYLTAEEKAAAEKKEPGKKEPAIVGRTGGKTGDLYGEIHSPLDQTRIGESLLQHEE